MVCIIFEGLNFFFFFCPLYSLFSFHFPLYQIAKQCKVHLSDAVMESALQTIQLTPEGRVTIEDFYVWWQKHKYLQWNMVSKEAKSGVSECVKRKRLEQIMKTKGWSRWQSQSSG